MDDYNDEVALVLGNPFFSFPSTQEDCNPDRT